MTGISCSRPPLDSLMPVGSIYLSVNGTNPSTLFGGTWEQIKDKFLLCAGSNYENGTTGGSATHLHSTANHTLTVNEIPSHVGHLYGNAGQVDGKGDAKGKWLAEVKSNGSSTSYGWNYANNEYYPVNRSLGGGAAHNHGNTGSSSNLPPYIAITVWKRVG